LFVILQAVRGGSFKKSPIDIPEEEQAGAPRPPMRGDHPGPLA
jgi:hypothetical protein